MVAISSSGSGEGPGKATTRAYSTKGACPWRPARWGGDTLHTLDLYSRAGRAGALLRSWIMQAAARLLSTDRGGAARAGMDVDVSSAEAAAGRDAGEGRRYPD
jgi:hypothetical protein